MKTLRTKAYAQLILTFQNLLNKNTQKSIRKLAKHNKELEEELILHLGVAAATRETKDNLLQISIYEKFILGRKLNKTLDTLMNEKYITDKKLIEAILYTGAVEKEGVLNFINSLGGVKFTKLAKEEIAILINERVAGKLWSERLWTNNRALETVLRKDIYSLLEGQKSTQGIIRDVKKSFSVNTNQARRLVNTEVARVQNNINEVFAENNNISQQMFMATLDNATSDVCQSLDGEIFDTNDPHIPSIPLHPNCRSVLVNMPNEDWRPETRLDNITKSYGNWDSYEKWKKDN